MRNYFAVFIFIGALFLSSCGVDSERGSRQLSGQPDELAITAIGDEYFGDSVSASEMQVDGGGRMLVRTKLEVRLADDATIGAVNALLDEYAMEITSSIAGYPSLVVRVPDQTTLNFYNDLVRRIERERAVAEVYRSYRAVPQVLPPNVADRVANNPNAEGWDYVGQHLPVRGPGAWNVQAALQSQPLLLVRDYFGLGDPRSPDIFNTTEALGDSGQRIRQRNLSDEDAERAKHGYLVLSLATATHGNANQTDEAEFVTGMMPQTTSLAAVDQFESDDNDLENLTIQALRRIVADNEGLVTVTLALGNECRDGATDLQDCNALTGNIGRLARKWTEKIRATGLEDEILLVSAAGNREAGSNEPFDATSKSIWNIAGGDDPLPGVLDDEVDIAPLQNSLIVENVRRQNGTLPVEPRCTADTSFTGGDVAGIGAGGIYGMADAASRIFRDPETNSILLNDGGTSSATAQVAGLAAYLSALDPTITPARAIRLITATAVPVPTGAGSGCANLGERAPLIDAYAAVLALDAPGLGPRVSPVRLALMDVVDSNGERNPDGVFDENDVTVWRAQLRPANDRFGEVFYDRWDLNGDGFHSGQQRFRFDLNASGLNGGPIYTPIERGYDERAVTDTEILCYYSFSPLYTGNIDERNVTLAGVCDEAPPISVPDTEPPTVPTGLEADAVSTTRIDLSWNASTDNETVVGYNLYRRGILQRQVVGTRIVDSNLEPGTLYCYQVSAVDSSDNESELSRTSCATTLPDIDVTPPSAPTNLQVTDVGETTISLSWDASTDDTGVVNYRVIRDVRRNVVGSVSDTSFTDTGLDSLTEYCYTVRAVDAESNESDVSNEVCATTDEPPPEPDPVLFTLIVDTDTEVPGGGANFSNFSDLSFDGNGLAFTANSVLYRADGDGISLIADPTDLIPDRTLETFGAISAPVIDGNRIAFAGANGIYIDDDGSLATVVDAQVTLPGSVETFDSFFGWPGIDGQDVVFGGADAVGNEGIFLVDTGNSSISALIDEATEIPDSGGAFFDGALFDDAPGSIAYSNNRLAFTYGNSGGAPSVYTREGGNLDTVFDAATVLPESADAFTSTSEVAVDNNRVLYTGANGTFTSVVRWLSGDYQEFDATNLSGVTPPTAYLGGAAASGDGGNVLFRGVRDGVPSGDEGYILYDGSDNLWLVGVNDEVDGKTVIGVGAADLSGEQAVILLNFLDGSSGLYLAEPNN